MGLFPKGRDLTRPPERVELPVRASDFGARAGELLVRLDAFLVRHLRWRSRSSIQELIRDGYVFVDAPSPDRPARGTPLVERRASRKLRDGALVVVVVPEELRLPPPSTDGSELDVLLEDEDLLAVDKPAGVPCHPSGRHLVDTVIQRVHARYRAGHDGLRLPVRLCHRLDLETSGVLLLAKGDRAHARLMRQFERRRVEKEYLAIVEGSPPDDEGLIDLPLGPSRASAVRLKIAVVEDGLPSRTRWRVLERHPHATLLRCHPETGRQHQIRVHLAALGHPIVGDKLYGPTERHFLAAARGELDHAALAELGLPRQALHSAKLAFRSPTTDERVEVESPLPRDLREYLDAG